MIEEIQLRREYQGTLLFYQFCKYLLSVMPADLQTLEAYAHKGNQRSIRIMEKLGMQFCQEQPDAPFVHLCASLEGIWRKFTKK